MNKPLILLMGNLLLSIAFLSPVFAEDGDARAADPAALAAELSDIRAQREQAEQSLAAHLKELQRLQHDIEYNDPELKPLREELIALEKQLLVKRQHIQVRLAMNPEIKKLEEQRKQLFQDAQRLRNTEAAIERELKAAGQGGS